jgi:transcriptional regulator with XRE-family HTH domain
VQRSLSPWVGLAIRTRRQTQGFSQEALAGQANLHRTYISLVERGKRNISVDALSAIADVLTTPPSQLMHEAERLRRRRSR